MRCLFQAGQLLDVLAHARDSANGSCRQIGALGVAATWRLGRWEEIKECLSSVEFNAEHKSSTGSLRCLNPQVDAFFKLGQCLVLCVQSKLLSEIDTWGPHANTPHFKHNFIPCPHCVV